MHAIAQGVKIPIFLSFSMTQLKFIVNYTGMAVTFIISRSGPTWRVFIKSFQSENFGNKMAERNVGSPFPSTDALVKSNLLSSSDPCVLKFSPFADFDMFSGIVSRALKLMEVGSPISPPPPPPFPTSKLHMYDIIPRRRDFQSGALVWCSFNNLRLCTQ